VSRRIALVLALSVVLTGCGGDAPDLPEGVELTPLTEDEVRDLARRQAMQILQSSMAAQMRLYVAEGRFTTDGDELDLPEGLTLAPRVGPGEGPETVAVRVCEEDAVVVLGTTTSLDEAFAVKARGLEPHEDGEAVFSHYTEATPPCDPSGGPEAWPGGWHVSRQGLQGPGEEAES
jgi:hypothetical protein